MFENGLKISIKTPTGIELGHDVMEFAIPIMKKHLGTRNSDSMGDFFSDVLGNLGHNMLCSTRTFEKEYHYYPKDNTLINLAIIELYRIDTEIYKDVQDGYYTLELYALIWKILSEVFEKTKDGDSLMSLYYDATKVYIITKNEIPKLAPCKVQISK